MGMPGPAHGGEKMGGAWWPWAGLAQLGFSWQKENYSQKVGIHSLLHVLVFISSSRGGNRFTCSSEWAVHPLHLKEEYPNIKTPAVNIPWQKNPGSEDAE